MGHRIRGSIENDYTGTSNSSILMKKRYIISIESGKEYNGFLRRIIKSTCSFPAWPGKFTACIDRIGIRYPCRICGRVVNPV